MLVVFAIVAIAIALAAPSLINLLQRNRVASVVNTFIGDLQYARSEAIKRGPTVSICPSTTGAACSGANAWQVGWIVFFDANGNGVVNASDQILRVRGAWSASDTFVAAPATTYITFGRTGFATNLGGASVLLTVHTSPLNGYATQCVSLNIVGHQTVQSAGTGTCA